MDHERLPPSENIISPPQHPSAEEIHPPIQPGDFFDPSNLRTTPARVETGNLISYSENVVSESPNSEKLGSIQSPLPVHLPEPEKRDANMVNNERYQQNTTTRTQRQGNGIDWIVPTEEGELLEKHTVKDRLQPTLEAAIVEKNKCIAKAKWTGLMLNVAIGMQVLLGSLTTGLSAVAVSGGKSTASATTALGALATLVASYLARARGSNEPELSITRTKDLDQFIRECRAFQLDHGHSHGSQFDPDIFRFRQRFEEILGNNGNSERKLAPPV